MQKLHSIQALRGFAALLVVFYHTLALTRSSSAADAWNHVLAFGSVGVDVFFVVSGYIMFFIRDRYIGPDMVRSGHFLWKRFLRVLPPYWIYTAIVICLFIFAPSLFKGETPNILRSLLLIPDDSPFFLMIGWTLSYEIYFYILFALTLLVTKRASTQITLMGVYFLACVIFGALFDFPGPVYAFATSHVHFEFLFGGLVCVFGRQLADQRLVALPCLCLAAVVYYLAISQGYTLSRNDTSDFSYFFAFASLLFIGAYSAGPVVSRFLVTPLQGLGNASYSLYLSHWLVLNAMTLVMKKTGYFGALSFTVISTTIACIYALWSYRLFERTIPALLETSLSKTIERFFAKTRMAHWGGGQR